MYHPGRRWPRSGSIRPSRLGVECREKAASQHAPADALPPPPRVVVPDEVVQQYDEIEAAAAPLIKQYFRRAMASKPRPASRRMKRSHVTAVVGFLPVGNYRLVNYLPVITSNYQTMPQFEPSRVWRAPPLRP